MLLSEAIKKGARHAGSLPGVWAECPLGNAYLGALNDVSRAAFLPLAQSMSADALGALMVRNLHRVFPHLGMTVRTWPRFLAYCQERGMVAKDKRVCPVMNNISLWRAVVLMSDEGMPKPEIAAKLAECGL